MKKTFLLLLVIAPLFCLSQNVMTPELLWKLGRLNAIGVSKDKKYIIYAVSTPNVAENKSSNKRIALLLQGVTPRR